MAGQQEQVQRYAAQLPQIDARLEDLRTQSGAAQQRLEQLRVELAKMVEAVSF